MGTKLQSKPYLPGYYSMRDLNEDANASHWSLFCDDKTLTNRHYYYGFASSPMGGYSDYDKELLKQTMLKHEATFRKQVYELHRLYRIQRDLMVEHQKKEFYDYSMSTEASQSNPFSSRIPSEYTPNMCHIPSLVNSGYCGPSVSGTDSRRSPLHFLKESSLQAGASHSQNGVSIKKLKLLDSKCMKVPKKTFDLQLPADVYIETEDGEGAHKEKVDELSLRPSYSRNVDCLIESEGGVSLSFGVGENPNCGETARKLYSHGVNVSRSHCLADLNEPIQGTSDVNTEASSSNLSGQVVFNVVQRHRMSMETNAGIPVTRRSSFLNIKKDRGQKTDLNTMHPDMEEKRGENVSENLSYLDGLGRNNASSCKPLHFLNKLSTSAEPLQVETKNIEFPQFVFSNRNKKETLSRERAAYGTHNANPVIISSNYSVQGAPSVPSLLSDNVDEIGSSSPTQWRNPRNNVTDRPIAIQALPGCNEAAVLNSQNKSSKLSTKSSSVSEKWDLLGCSRLSRSMLLYKKSEPNSSSLQCVGFEMPKDCSPYEQNEVHECGKVLKGFNCADVKSAKDMHLNVYLPSELQGEDKPSQDTAVDNGREGENGAPSGIPWLRKKPAYDEPASSRGSSAPLDFGLSACSRPPCLPDTRKWPFGSGTGNLKDISLGFDSEPGSTLHSNDAVSQKIKIIDSASGAKVLGFPLLKNSNISKCYPISGSLSMHCQDNFKVPDDENDVKIHLDHLPCDHLSSEMEKQLDIVRNPASQKEATETSPSGERCCINLNVAVSAWDEVSQPLFFPEADAENLTCLPRTAVVNTTGIDLEAPISLQDDSSHLEAEALTSQWETPAQVLQCEREDSQVNLAKVAAETIMDISAAVCNTSLIPTYSSSSLEESLLWFSEVVLANACDLKNQVRVSRGKAEGNDEPLDSGDNSFEALSLKITETKFEVESCNKPWQQENQKYEMMGPSPWLSRPRKRYGRRGRQRKDFQRDILPGLVTLSRHEVTEDLQVIGGQMKASDCSWQAGVVGKTTARNGWHCPSRGRRQPRVSAAAVAVTMVNPLPQTQPVNGEVEHEGINLRGWGKTTRRCRRQRLRTADFSTHIA